MKTQPIFIFLTVLTLVLSGCAGQAFPPTPTPVPTPTTAPTLEPTKGPPSPADVVMGVVERAQAGDVDGVMAYFAPDARLYLAGLPPTGIELSQGTEQIRAFWEDNFSNHFQWEVEITRVSGSQVIARVKTWHDFTRQLGVAPLEWLDVYKVKDGKITTYSGTITQESLGRLMPALAEVMPPEPPAEPASETPVSQLTVTFADGTCSYNGPLALQAGEIQVTFDVHDQSMNVFGLTFFTLAPDKSMLDLMAATILSAPPDWANMFSLHELGHIKSESYRIMVEEGPVYAVCWGQPPDIAIGNVGPFTVVSPSVAVSTQEPVETLPALEIPPSDLVVTFADGKCTLNDPLNLKAGENTVTMVVLDGDHDLFAFALLNLDSGKNKKDALKYFTAPSEPAWVHEIEAHDAIYGDVKTYNVNLEAKPLFVACVGAYPDKEFGSHGPIEVSP